VVKKSTKNTTQAQCKYITSWTLSTISDINFII